MPKTTRRSINIVETYIVAGDKVHQDNSMCFTRPSLSGGSGGSFYCCALVGRDMTGPDGRIKAYKSIDDCKTWRELTSPAAHDEHADAGYGFMMCYIRELGPDTLIAAYVRVERFERDQLLFHPETDGIQPSEVRIVKSYDGGISWTRPRTLDYKLPDPIMPTACMMLADGTLAIPCEIYHEWDKGFQEGPSARLIFSYDQGETWPEAAMMAVDPAKRCFYGDPRIATLDDGTMVALFWKHDLKLNQDCPVHRAESLDNGRTWSKPHDTGLVAQIASPLLSDQNKMFCIYQERFGPEAGLKSISSYDSGNTWDPQTIATIYKAGLHTDNQNPFTGYEEYTFGNSSVLESGRNQALVSLWRSNGQTKYIEIIRIESD